MKIIRLVVENFKRIVAVDITPDSHIQIISGRNSQGKSSILDAIYAALKTKEIKKTISKPVRDGEESCFIQLDLGEYIVTRTINEDGKYNLRVETPAGEQVRSPQAILDDITGAISLDPLRFIQAKPVDQVTQLTEAFNIDLTEFDAECENLKEERKLEKRQLGAIKSKLQQLKPPTGNDPEQTVDVSELNDRLQELLSARSKQSDNRKKIKNLKASIEQLTAELQKLESDLDDTNYDVEIKNAEDRIRNVGELNARASEVLEYHSLSGQRDDLDRNIGVLNDKIELVNINKSEALESISLPVDGLHIEPDGLMFDDIPFSQLSQSQQLKVAMSVVMAANPKLRVLRITQGSLMDDENMDVVRQMAEEHDFQVWIEVVDPDGTVGLCIEEGVVKHDANDVEQD